MSKEFLNINELSEYIGMPVNTIYYKTSKREIPFYKPSRKLLFKKDEIDNWVSLFRISTQSEINDSVNSRFGLKKAGL